MQLVVRTLCWIGVLYVFYCGLLFVFQRRIMYPRYLVQPPPAGYSPKEHIEKIWIDTRQGQVETWFLPPLNRGNGTLPGPVMIIAHGNGELIDGLPGEFGWLTGEGIGLLLVEYPGYGRSAGAPTRQSIEETFLSAYDMLIQRPGVDPDKVILMGRSLGGGPACFLADARPSAALILISTFTSTRAFAINYLAPGFLIRDNFDNLALLERYEKPALIVHGTRDTMIPHTHGLQLSKATRQGTLISYECAHNDCPPDFRRFRKDMLTFLMDAGIP